MIRIALLSLICLISGAAAQTIFTGEGYTGTQLSFLDGAGASTGNFEPLVTNYWSTYIQNPQNITPQTSSPKNTMSTWYNSFPMRFDQPITLSKTSFESGVSSGKKYSEAEMNTMVLERFTLTKFSQVPASRYSSMTPSSIPSSSFSVAPDKSKSVTASSSGQVLSQGIVSLFTT